MHRIEGLSAACARARESLEAYSLDAVEAAERASVETHLARCPACASEASRFAEVAALLGRSAPQAPLPPGLRDRVLSRAAAESRPRLGWRPRIMRPALSAVAAAVAVGSLAWALALQFQFNVQQATLASLASEEARYEQGYGQIVSVLRWSDLHVRELNGTPAAPAAYGRVMVDPSRETGMLVVWNLPPIPAERAFQVWFVADSGRRSGGVIRPDDRGHGSFVIRVPPDLAGFQAIGLTEEPATGSDGPTGRRVLFGQL